MHELMASALNKELHTHCCHYVVILIIMTIIWHFHSICVINAENNADANSLTRVLHAGVDTTPAPKQYCQSTAEAIIWSTLVFSCGL